jgi:aldehyde dehydrogenase (NAD+)
MAAGAETIKRVFLELGGKSAHIVLDDVDDIAGAVASPCFAICTHGGQGCATSTRLLVPRDRYDEAVEAAAGMVAAMPYGDPSDPGNLMGAIVNAAQRDRIEGMVNRAVADGARLVVGGKRPEHLTKGFWYEPTLLADVTNDMAIARDEIFGPVLVVIAYDGEDDAVRSANDSIFGLSGGIVSASDERAHAVAKRIRTGTMSINGGLWYGADVPFGGFKQSGVGREMGVAGFEEYLEQKAYAKACP